MKPHQGRRVVDLRPLRLDAYPDYEERFEELGEHGWLWVLEQLSVAWQEAQFDASLAYSHWCRMRDRTTYSTYRAAQDRADAAQDALSMRNGAEPARDALARWTRDLATGSRA
jgi:hypothetical protein